MTEIPAMDKNRAYYNFDKLNSFNGYFNFCVGMRGVGKTFGAKLRAIKRFIKKDEQFIYLRRYKDELQFSRDTFFDDIIAEGYFPEWDFRINGKVGQMALKATKDDKKRVWKTCVHFIPLSISQSFKSVPFPKVYTIIYDEFIIEKGNVPYISNEATKFLGFYSTVARNREGVKVYFLANAVSITNPYFLYYKIRPDQVGEFSQYKNGFIVCHFVESAEFKTEVYKTRFGQFIQDTEYADYAVSNQFADNHEELLGAKSPAAVYYMTLETAQGTFSVWMDYKEHKHYIQEKRPKKEFHMTLLPEKMGEGKILLTPSDKILSNMRTSFRHGRVIFDTAQSREAFIEVFKR